MQTLSISTVQKAHGAHENVLFKAVFVACKSLIYRSLPPPILLIISLLRARLTVWHSLTGGSPPLTPPKEGDFCRLGNGDIL
jgi:hypothetical protein